jgi:hypothetical protein
MIFSVTNSNWLAQYSEEELQSTEGAGVNKVYVHRTSCSRFIVNHIILSPTLSANPTSFVLPCKVLFKDCRFKVLQLLSLTSDFSSKF